jgi:hypothetical protein
MRWICLVFVPLLLAPVSSFAQITDKVSDITGERRVMSKNLRDITIQSYPGNDAGILAKYEADSESGEETWSLGVYGFADSTTSMTAVQQITLEAGGEQVQPLQVEGKTRRMDDGTVVEIKTATFTRSIFARIARAESMTITIGAATFTASRRARRDMRTILETVPPPNARPTASSDGESRR